MNEAEARSLVSSLYESWYPAAVRYALRLTGRLDVAEDTVQECFLTLYKDLRAGRAIGNPKAWVLSVIRVQIRVRMESGELRALMSTLTVREQEVLFLRLAEMKYREIAARLKISSSSVNTLLARALRKLQQAYQADSLERPHRQPNENVSKTLQ
jgi:RNA polymerase sigma-70 factor (ECF subfamily)